MFDFHMHSRVSFDGHDTGEQLLLAAEAQGLKEICFTDHLDYDPLGLAPDLTFATEDYAKEYNHLTSQTVKIRRGMEFGLLPDNQEQFARDLKRRPFDFVIGSIHFSEDRDIYYPPYWEGKTIFQAERQYLEQTLQCVQAHDGFDVLGHLTYIAKAHANPVNRPVKYTDHAEVIDEILKELVRKGKGMEINTSGVDASGDYLPGIECLRRFKELGGEIVTVGSDAHKAGRVGQYCREACTILGDIFGYVCTFEHRQPIFHKL